MLQTNEYEFFIHKIHMKNLISALFCWVLLGQQTTKAQLLVELKSPNTAKTITEAHHQVRLLPGFSAKALQNSFQAKINNICWQTIPLLGPNKNRETYYNVLLPQNPKITPIQDAYYKIAKSNTPTETNFVQLKQTNCLPYELPYTKGTPYVYHGLYSLVANAKTPNSFVYTEKDIITESANSSDELTKYGGDNKFCGIVLVLPNQDFSLYQNNLSLNKTCFVHDAAGNLVGTQNCSSASASASAFKSASVNNSFIKEEIAEPQGPIDLGDSFVAYPNPTDGLFYLAWNNKAENPLKNVQLTSVGSGQTQSVSFTNANGLTTIDLSAKSPGLYILQLFMSNGSTKSIKVIRK
jgi:hypothetical protein